MVALPRILEDGKTPSQWVDEMRSRGVEVSERALRERARRLGACKLLGKAMILLPEHIELIFEEPSCHSPNTSETASTGFEDALLIATSTSERASQHLMKLSQKRPSGNSKGRRGNVVSLARTPQN